MASNKEQSMVKHSIIVSAFLTLGLSSSLLAGTVSYMSDKSIKIYQAPTATAPAIKTIGAGQVIEGSGESIDGYIPIVGGYVKESDLMPFKKQTQGHKSIKALVDNTFSTKEIPVEYVGTVVANDVNLRSCASVKCETVGSKNKGDNLEIISKTADGAWYKTPSSSYISSKYITLEFKQPSHPVSIEKAMVGELASSTSNTQKIEPQAPVLPKEEKVDFGEQKSVVPFENTRSEVSDELLAHSGELAKKYENEAHIKNLTKTATPMPVKIPARYARALDFPILNKSGDVYTDYTFVWIKIKDEEFVLGKREGKATDGQFTINKRIN